MDSVTKRKLEVRDKAGIGVAKNFRSIVVDARGYENLEFGERDCHNYGDKQENFGWGSSC